MKDLFTQRELDLLYDCVVFRQDIIDEALENECILSIDRINYLKLKNKEYEVILNKIAKFFNH